MLNKNFYSTDIFQNSPHEFLRSNLRTKVFRKLRAIECAQKKLKPFFRTHFIFILTAALGLFSCQKKTAYLLIENPAFDAQNNALVHYHFFSPHEQHVRVQCQTILPFCFLSRENSLAQKNFIYPARSKNFFLLEISSIPNTQTEFAEKFSLFASLPLDESFYKSMQDLNENSLQHVFLNAEKSSEREIQDVLLRLEKFKIKSIFIFFAPLPKKNYFNNYRYYMIESPVYKENPNVDFFPVTPVFYFFAPPLSSTG